MAKTYTVEAYFDALNNREIIDRESVIVDTAANIKEITAFPDISIKIKISDASFSLTLEQYNRLTQNGWTLGEDQALTLSDTFDHIKGLAEAELTSINNITLTDTSVSLTVAQYDLLQDHGLTIAETQTFIISDTADNIDNLTSGKLTALKTAGFKGLNVSDDQPLALRADQVTALTFPITSTGAVTVSDTAYNLLALIGSRTPSALATLGITSLDATDNAVTLTAAQYNALRSADLKFSDTDQVTLADLGSNLSGLDATFLKRVGVDILDATDASWTLSSAQFKAFKTKGISLVSTDDITLSDTLDNITKRVADDLTDIDHVTITDSTYALTLTQLAFLNANRWSGASGQTVTLQVSAAELKDATNFSAIKDAGLPVDVTDASWSLTVAQLTAFTSVNIRFAAGESFTIVDTADYLKTADFVALKAAGATGVTVSDNLALTLTAAQATALSLPITSTGAVTVAGSSAELLTLIDAKEPATLVAFGIKALDATDNAVSLTTAQYAALKATTLRFAANDVVTLAATGATLKGLDPAALQSFGVKVIDATDNSLTLSASQLQAFADKGISFASGDNVTIVDTAANITTAGFAAIKAAGATGITVDQNGALTLTAAQATTLSLPITSTGPVTVAGSSGDLLTLIGAKGPETLVALGIKSFDATDNAVTLSYATFNALKATALRFAADDVLTYTATAGNTKGLTGYEEIFLNNLRAFGVTQFDATDTSWSLDWAQLKFFKDRGISLVSADDITLSDTLGNITARNASDLANIDHITITDPTYALTLAQHTFLKAKGWAATSGQTVTLQVSLAEITDATQRAAIKAAALPVDVIDPNWSLTVAQFTAVNSANLPFISGETFTLSDTAANLIDADGFLKLTVAQLTALDAAKATGITVTGATKIYLTPDQAAALKIRISGAQVATNNNVGSEAQPDANTLALIVKGTGAEIASKISADLFAHLADYGITDLNASDDKVSLSAAQYKGLVGTSLRFDSSDGITLSAGDLTALTPAQITDLKSNGVVKVESTSTLALTVDQYKALVAQGVDIAATNDIIIQDTSEKIATLSPDDIGVLAAKGVDKIDSTSGSLSLTRAQQDKLAEVGIGTAAGDTVTTVVDVFTYKNYTLAEYLLAHPLTNVVNEAARLVDTAANLAKITPEIAGYFKADKVTQISATDTNLSITITQFDAIKGTGVTYDVNNVVSIVADVATLTGFTGARLADFKANGVDVVGSDTPATAWTLTVAQYKAVIDAGLGFAQGDTITLADTAANLQTRLVIPPLGSNVDISRLAANGVDKIATTPAGAGLSFSVEQAKNLGAVTFATGFVATVIDTAAVIGGMTGDQLAAASAAGFNGLDARDNNPIKLSYEQATKLGNLRSSEITLTDSGTNIAKLTVAQINDLADKNNVHSYDVTGDNKVSLTADQLVAIVAKGVSFAKGAAATADIVTLSDLAANIKGLESTTIAGLKTAGATGITVKDNRSLELNADQADALNIKIKSTGAVTLVDTGGEIVDKIDAEQMGKLKDLGFTKINVSDNTIALKVDQYLKLKASTLTFTTGDVVSIKDTGAKLNALGVTEINSLSFGIQSIYATGDLFLSFDQLRALVAKAITFGADGAFVLSDSASVLTALSLDDLAYLNGKNVVRIDASDDAYNLTVEQYQALRAAGIALTTGDAVTLSDNGINIASLTKAELDALFTNGVDYIDLQKDGDDVYSLNLTAEKWQALFKLDSAGHGVQFTSSTQTLLAASITASAPIATLLDTAAAIQVLEAADLAAIAAQNVVIDSSTNAVTLSSAQYNALAALNKTQILADGDVVTLSIADGEMPGINARSIGNLGRIGVDIISAQDGTLTLTKEQYDGLAVQATLAGWQTRAVLKASDTFTLSISKEAFELLDSIAIKALSTNGIDKIFIEGASGGARRPLSLSVDKAGALGSLKIENASSVTLSDAGSNIEALSAATLAALVNNGFTQIDATDNTLNLSVDQYLAIVGTTCKLNLDDSITLRDTAAAIAQRNPSQFAAMAGNGVDKIYTTDTVLSLKVEQAIELGAIVVDHQAHAATYVGTSYFQISDTAANISKLTQLQLQRLNANLLDQINSTEGRISLTGAQLMALDTIKIATGNVVTLFDYGADIAQIDFRKLATIGAVGQTNVIDARDNDLKITVQNFRDIYATINWKLNANDVVTLADNATNLGNLTVPEISGAGTEANSLAGRGIDFLRVTGGGELQLRLDQYKALIATSCRLTADDQVALKDITQLDLDALTPAIFRALAGNGIDTIKIAADANINVNVEKYLALGVVKIATLGTYTLNDGAAAIAALTKDQFAALDDNGVDVIAVSDNQPLRLTVEQYRNLGSVVLTSADTVILSDTVAHLNELTKDEIARLTAAHVDSIEPTDGPFSLTLDKAKVLNGVKFEGANTVTVTGTGTDISGLGDSGIAALSAAGVDVIDADGTGPVTLTVAMLDVLGAMTFAAGDAVTLADRYDALTRLVSINIAKLGAQGVDVIDSTQGDVRWSVDQATQLGRVTLGSTYKFVIGDFPNLVQALNATQITSLASAGLDGIDVGANIILSLTAAQANALTLTTASAAPGTYSVTQQIVVNASADVTLSDSGANIAALSAREIGYLASVGVDQIDVIYDSLVTITVDQYKALGTAEFTARSEVTLADTAEHLKALTAGEIATLRSQGVDFVNPTDATLDLDAAQAAALPSGVTFTGTNLVRIVDTGAAIGRLDKDQIALLDTVGVALIDASDNAITLTVAQANKLGAIKIASGDTVTVSDTVANIHGMDPSEIAVLGGKGIDVIDAKDSPATTLNLSVLQAKALGSVTLGATNLVQIQDSALSVEGLSGAALTSLARAGLDGIDVGADALSLTAAQANALTLATASGAPGTYTVTQQIVVNASADVTLSDSGANIAALSAREIRYLASVGVDQIDVTLDHLATITVDQFKALGTAKFTAGSKVTLADTAEHLKALTAGEIATLQSQGVDFVNPTDATLDLDAAQAAALPSGVTFTGTNLVQIVDSGTNISIGLSGAQIARLNTAGVDWIDASNDAIKLTVDQANKLGSIKIASGDLATLSDTADTIHRMQVGEISALGAKGIDIIDANDSTATTLNLSVLQAKALGSVTLGATNLVKIQDSALAVQGLSVADLTSLARAGLDGLDVGANALSLTAAQANALTLTTASAIVPVTYSVTQKIVVNDSATVTLSDTGANIARLSAREIGYLAAVGVDKIDSTDVDKKLSLSVAQYQALGAVALTSGDNVTLLDTAANLSALQPTDLTALAGKNIDVIDVSDNALELTVAQYKALFLPATGVKLTGADVITLKDKGGVITLLTADEMAGLALNGVDFIDAYDATAAAGSENSLTLSVQQYLRLIATSTALTAGDVVTIKDTASAIKGLTYAQITQLAANNVDFVDASDVDLELTVGDAKAFGSVKFGATKNVIVRDGADVISATSGADIQKLTDNGVDRFEPITNYLRLTVAQATALGSAIANTTEAIVLDSAANIQRLTDLQIAALARSGIDRIDVEDDLATPAVERNLSLSVDQYRALIAGGIELTPDDYVTLTDTTEKIEGLTDSELSGLLGNLIDAIDVSGAGALALTADRLSRLGTVSLTPADVVTLADSGVNIANLGATGIAALAGKFIDFIDATGDGKLTLDIASYNVLGTVKLTDGDTVTLADTAAKWKLQSASFFTGLNGKFIDAITVTDGDHSLALTVAQYRELIKYTRLTDTDTVTLSDTAGNLQGLTVAEIQALKANFVDKLDATDAMLDLPLDKANAIPAGVTFGTSQDVRVVGTGGAISSLNASQIAALRDAGVDKIDAQGADQGVTLDLEKVKSLGAMVFDVTDNVVLRDTAANLAAANLTPDLITRLGATNGVDRIKSSDGVLAFTVDQYLKLIATSMKLTPTDTVTLSDTAEHLKGLTPEQIAALATNLVDYLDVSSASDTTLDLSVDQVKALPVGVKFGATKDVRIVDTGTAISGLTADRITLLNAAGLDKIDATDADPVVKLTAAKVAALGAITIASGDDVSLSDNANAIKIMAFSTFQGLSAHGIDKIDATDGTLDLTVAQATANGRAVTLGDTHAVRIVDAGGTISNLNEEQIKDLDAAGLDFIDANNDVVTLTALKAKALGQIVIASGDAVTLIDSGANIATQLSDTDFGKLAGNGVDSIDVNGDNKLSLTVAQYRALVATTCKLTASDIVSLSDTADNLKDLSAEEIAALAINGVDYVDSSSGVMNWTVDQATALPALVKFGATNLVQIADTVAEIDTLTVVEIKALDTAGLDYIDAVDAVYRVGTFAVSLSVDKALALGAIKMALDDTVTLADSAGKIGGVSTQQLGKLKDANIDIIDVGGDGKMSLTVERFNALGTVQLTGTDTITLSDTAIALKSLWDGNNTISTLATRNVDFIDVTVGQLNLTVDEAHLLPIYGADSLPNIKFATSNNANSVRIVDTANKISTDLSASDFAALSAASVNVIDAIGNGAVTLDFAKAKALDSIAFDATDTVTMTIDAADLAAAILTPDLITRLGAVNGVDRILSSAADNTLSLTVDQYKALIATSMKLTLSDKVTLADTAAKLNTLSAADLGLLDDNGIDQIQPTDGPLSLTVAKATSIADGVRFVGSNPVQIVDAGTTISNMSADQIAILARSGLTSIDATPADPNVTLSVRMATALGSITFAANDNVTLSDYGSIIGSMSADEIAKLQRNGVDSIDVIGDERLTLSVAKFTALGTVKITQRDTVTLADTQANLQAIRAEILGALGGNGIDFIDSANDTLVLKADQAQALARGSVVIVSTDTVTLADNGASIATNLDAADFGNLAGRGVDQIDASDDALFLTVDQYRALVATSTKLTGADTVTIRDLANNLLKLNVDEIRALKTNGVDSLDASDAVLDLPLVKANAIPAGVTFGATNDVRVVDTGTAISSLTALEIAALRDAGVDKIDARSSGIGVLTNQSITLDLAQAKALGAMVFDTSDTVTLKDTAANLAAANLTNTDIARFAANGVDLILSSEANHTLSLTVAQYRALVATLETTNPLRLTPDDEVTLSDTAANLKGLGTTEIAALATIGVDTINVSSVTDTTLDLTVEQVNALPEGVNFGFIRDVRIVDTGTAISGLMADRIAQLEAAGLDRIDATDADPVIKLTAAKVVALGDSTISGNHYITIASGDDVTLSDTADAIKTMALSTFKGLSAHGVDKIDATDAMLDLTVEQATAIPAGVTFGATKDVRVVDTGTAISSLTAREIAALRDAGVDKIDARSSGIGVLANQSITLDLAQAKALGAMVFDTSDTVTLKDTAANLAAANLTNTDIARFAANGVDFILSSEANHTLSLTVAQYRALVATLATTNPLRLTPDDEVTLSDTAANLKGLRTTEIAALATIGVDTINVSSVTDTTLDLTVEQVNALPEGVNFGFIRDVRIVDTGTAISGLTAERITLLNAAGLDKIDATDADPVIKLTAAKVVALGDSTYAGTHYIIIASGDDVTLSDTADAIKSLALTVFWGLSAHGVDKIDATDGTLDLTVAQATPNGPRVTLGVTNKVRIVDAGDTISAMSEQEITDLDTAGLDFIDANNDVVTLTALKAKALGNIVIASGDGVTLVDSGANVAQLSDIALGKLAGNGVDAIDVNGDDKLSLTVEQYRALVATTCTLTALDIVTLSDTAANLKGLEAGEIAALATNGVDVIDSKSGVLNWTVAQATALSSAVKFGATNDVQIVDTGFNISTGLSDAQIASLSAAGLDRIDASDDYVNLTALKAKALGNIVIASGDKVTLADSGTNIATLLSASDLGKLAGNGVDVIDVSGDDKLSLTVDQYRALVATSCKLTQADTITLSDTASNLATLQPTEIAALATNGVDVVTATDATLSWTVAQATALPSTITFGGSYVAQIADTVANINTLTVPQIQALNTRLAYIDAVDASLNPADLPVSLTADKAAALGSIKMAPGDIVTLADSTVNIGGLSTDQLSKLKIANIDFIDVGGDGKMSLTVERFTALGSVKLTAADTITLSDTASALKTLWDVDNTISSLAQKNIDFVDVTDGPLSLTATEAGALPVFDANRANNIKFTTTNNANVVKIVDAGSSISTGLNASQIAALSAAGVNAIDATDNALSLSVDQAKALGGIVIAAGDIVTLLDDGSTIAANLSDVDIGKLAAHGVDRIDARDNLLSLTVAQYRALGTVKLTLGDTVTLADTAENLSALSASDLRSIGDNGIDQIKSTDAPLILSVSKATAIGDGVSFVGPNKVQISDAGSVISRMTADQIAILARAGLSVIDATDADTSVKLTVAMATALGAIKFGPNDVVTLSDLGPLVGALSVEELGKLKDNSVNCIDVNGDNKLSLSVDQFNALGSVKLTDSDTVTLTDTQANLERLDASALPLLGGKGIDVIDSFGDVLTLSLAKLNALEADSSKKVALTQTDVVTLQDTQQTLESLNATALGLLGGKGIDIIDSLGDALTLDVSKLNALESNALRKVSLTQSDTVTLKDTQLALQGLDVAALGLLGGKGIDIIDSLGDALTLSLAKLNALEADANRKVSLTADDTVTLADAKETIQGLSATDIGALARKGVDIIDSTSAGDGLALRVDQYQSLGRVALTQSDTVSLVDTQLALESLDATAIGNLGANGVDILDSTGDVLNLSVAKFKALAKDPTRKVALTTGDLVTLVDTGAEIAKLSKQDIIDLGAGLVDRIDASGPLALTVEQYRALGAVALTAANTVTLADTAANLALLSQTEIGLLGARGIDYIDATDNALSLSLDQYLNLGAVKLTASDTVSLADTATNIGNLSLQQLRALGSAGVDKIDVTGDVLDWSLAQYKAAVSSVTFAANDKVTFENGRDFNQDGRSDILMQSSVNGEIFLWNMNGLAFASYGSFGGVPGTVWVAKGTGDFDNNGYTDILFQNSTNGSCYIWEKGPGVDKGLVADKTLLRHGVVGGTPGLDWKVVGTGDFNGDHATDILFQNAIDGSCVIWLIDGAKPLDGMNSLKGYGVVGQATGLDWKVKGVGDFNGDGVSDIVFQNIKNGAVYLWNIDGSKPLSGKSALKEDGYVGGVPGTDWQLKVVGDFNNDGKDDLLFQNSKDGSCYIWELDGVNKLVDDGLVGGSPGTVWSAVASGDFNADGKSDVLFQNTATNEYYIWELNGTKALVNDGSVAKPPSEWHAIT